MNTWIIYALITIAYIVILVVYFIRRSKSHENELSTFLKSARSQLEEHKAQANYEANKKVTLAVSVIKKVQSVAQQFEEQAQKEYDSIIEESKHERREILSKTKAEIEELFTKADEDLKDYREKRYKEVERNLVKLVVAVSERVVETGFSDKDHRELIHKCLEEVAQQKQRS